MARLGIPVGISDFEKIRKNGYYYVDKSGLIAELLEEKSTEVTLITRPRRFGKTLGMSWRIFLIFEKKVQSCSRGWKLRNKETCAVSG